MILEKTNIYICEYCKSQFTREKTLVVHMCEPKRRFIMKDEKHVIIGYHTFNKFFQFVQKNLSNKSYNDFATSPYYNAFVKFGSFVNNINPLYPDKFIDWIIKSGVKLDHWCKEELYERYVLELIHTESVETALERSIRCMTEWAQKNNSVWDHYFRYASSNRAVYDIKDGKISPWLLLNCESGKKLLSELLDEQLNSISTIIDPQVWRRKFKEQKSDLEFVKQVVKESTL